MLSRTAVIVAVAGMVACIPEPFRDEPPPSTGWTDRGSVVYAAPGPRSIDLWILPATGGESARLTRTPHAHELDPASSPDGTRIAFSRRSVRGGPSAIWVMDLDGESAHQLTESESIDREPAWSPEGTQIVWVRSFPWRSASELWVMDGDGGDQQRLLAGAPFRYDASPDWSPDGQLIAFTSNREGGAPQIFVVSSDGERVRRLSDGPAMNGNPAWSPDGRRLAFDRRSAEGNADIWVMSADGSGMSRLGGATGEEGQPAWDPNGGGLVFTHAADGGGMPTLFIMSSDGSSASRLRGASTAALSPDWSLADAPNEEPATGASVVRPRGGSQNALAFEARDDHALPPGTTWERITREVRLLRFRSRDSDVYALEIALDGKATIDVALAFDQLPGREPTSRIAARHGAVAAVNGDFAEASGRPLHPFAEDGELKMSSLVPSVNFALSADQGEAYFGRPVAQLTLSRGAGVAWPFDRWNSGVPSFGEIAAYSPPAGEEDRPPKWSCAARLLPEGLPAWAPERAGVVRRFRVDAVACGPRRMARQGGIVLATRPTSDAALLISSLGISETLTLTWSFGWRGVTDSIGGFPLLLRDGDVSATDCGGSLCRRHPRTGVGVKADGHLLLVVVDGRQRDSAGITLVEFARIFKDLGAMNALNLDGGSSSTMVVGDAIVNDPSLGFERPTSSAVLVLPGKDQGETLRP